MQRTRNINLMCLFMHIPVLKDALKALLYFLVFIQNMSQMSSCKQNKNCIQVVLRRRRSTYCTTLQRFEPNPKKSKINLKKFALNLNSRKIIVRRYHV